MLTHKIERPKLKQLLTFGIVLWGLSFGLLWAKEKTALHVTPSLPKSSVQAPALLSFADLQALAAGDRSNSARESRVAHLLNTPFLFRASSSSYRLLDEPTFGPSIRVASWNIERGFHLSEIQQIFASRDSVGDTAYSGAQNKALNERDILSKSHILLLSEVDYGMKRTQYQTVFLNLAKSLHMNAAYAVEYIELGPLVYQKAAQSLSPEARQSVEMGEEANIDPDRYKGLHGGAVLSRFPIKQVQIVRLPVCYDWYTEERKKLSAIEKVRRTAADQFFLETVLTEVREGSRIAIVADLSVPELPEKTLTVVSAHLENRTKPSCRLSQMEAIQRALANRHNPVVMGGDWNTSGGDVSPTSVRKEVRNRVTNPAFWTKRAIALFVPLGFVIDLGLSTTQYLKNLNDPVALNIPLIAENHERELFKYLESFRFSDGTQWDFRGEKSRSANQKGGLLANSNERALKGFEPTYSFERPWVKGLVGKYKLDWILVKAYLKEAADKGDTPVNNRMAPYAGRTLSHINTLFSEKLSDHTPLTVDLPVNAQPDREPTKPLTKSLLKGKLLRR